MKIITLEDWRANRMEAKRYISGKVLQQVGGVTYRLSANSLFTLEAMNLSTEIDESGQLMLFCEENRSDALIRLQELQLFVSGAIRWLKDNTVFDSAITELESGLMYGRIRVPDERATYSPGIKIETKTPGVS